VDPTGDAVDVKLTSGAVTIDALAIANPEGFDRSEAIASLGNIDVQADPGSLLGDTVTVDHIKLNDLVVNLELDGTTPNFQPILDRLTELGGDSEPAEPSNRKFKVGEVSLTGMDIYLRMDTIGGGQGENHIQLPDFKLEDIGGEEGATMTELQGIITKAVMQHVVNNAGNLLPAIMTASLTAGLENLTGLGDVAMTQVGDAAKLVSDGLGETIGQFNEQTEAAVQALNEGISGVTEGVNDAVQGATQGVDDALQGVGEGLGNLLGGGGDDD
jgi:hypothetical protein